MNVLNSVITLSLRTVSPKSSLSSASLRIRTSRGCPFNPNAPRIEAVSEDTIALVRFSCSS